MFSEQMQFYTRTIFILRFEPDADKRKIAALNVQITRLNETVNRPGSGEKKDAIAYLSWHGVICSAL